MKNKNKFMNKLPNPISLVIFSTMIIVLTSVIFQNKTFEFFDVQTNSIQTLKTINLTSHSGFSFMFNSLSANFVNFQPLWLGIFGIITFGLFESSGLSRAFVLFLRRHVDIKIFSYLFVCLGILSSLYINIGYVVLIPIACYIYHGYGQKALTGVVPALIGVASGFTVNIFLSTTDVTFLNLNKGFFTVLLFTYDYAVSGSLYFFFVYTVVVTAVIGFYTNKFLLNKSINRNLEIASLTKEEQFAFVGATFILLVYIIFFSYLLYTKPMFFKQSFITNQESIEFFKEFGFAYIVLVGLAIISLGHGFFLGIFKTDNQVYTKTIKHMNKFTYFYVLAFLFAQAINFYQFSNLDRFAVYSLSQFLVNLQLKSIFLVLSVVIIAFVMNLFLVSSAVKWKIVGPMLLPTMYAQGHSFEFTTLLFRIGESTSNSISPTLIYIPFILAFIFRFDENIKLGEIISKIYKATFLVLIIILILVTIFYSFNIPIGNGVLPKI